MEFAANPLLQLALVVSGLLLCLYLFASLKGELRRGERKRLQQKAEFEKERDALRAQLDALKEALREAEDRSRPASVSGMNLNKRSQVVRLHRRGERPEQIAAALSIPLNEVELLLKVHRTVVGKL